MEPLAMAFLGLGGHPKKKDGLGPKPKPSPTPYK